MKSNIHNLIILCCFSLLIIVSCSKSGGQKHSSQQNVRDAIVELGEDYFARGAKNITPEDVYTAIQKEEDIFIIDMRRPGDFDTLGHIEGAVNWHKDIFFENVQQIPENNKIILMCYSGFMSSQAVSILNLIGHDAYNLKWGMCGWTADETVNLGKWTNWDRLDLELQKAENMPVEKYEPIAVSTQAKEVKAAIIELADSYFKSADKHIKSIKLETMLSWQTDDVLSNDPFIICCMPKSNYKAGHIPGAVIMGWGKCSKYELAYVPTDRPIVVYCYTGQSSAQMVSYLNILGYDAYNLKFGANYFTDDTDILKHWIFNKSCKYSPPKENYPLVKGI